MSWFPDKVAMRRSKVCNRRWLYSMTTLVACGAVLLLVVGCAAPAPVTFAPGSATLTVHLEGFRNDHGTAIVSLFRGEKGFPDEVAASAATVNVPIREGQATAVFTAVSYGDYAVSVLHDENDDGQMATGLLGTPREGFGFSGYPDYRFGHPAYAQVHFLLVEPQREMTIGLRYETGRRQHQKDGRAAGTRRPQE